PNSLPVERLQNIPHVSVAFDADNAGDAAARAVLELLPQSKRLKPKAKDWNQQLLDYQKQLFQQHHQPEDDLTL
ncbi:MAG: toprim domain-containing protein, partial [Nostoc sp.]